MAYTVDDARIYIGKVHWQFASTMVDIRREYTIRSWRRESETDFLAFALLIRSNGTVEPWPLERPKYHMHYLVVDCNKYWALGPPSGDSGPLEDMSVMEALERLVQGAGPTYVLGAVAGARQRIAGSAQRIRRDTALMFRPRPKVRSRLRGHPLVA